MPGISTPAREYRLAKERKRRQRAKAAGPTVRAVDWRNRALWLLPVVAIAGLIIWLLRPGAEIVEVRLPALSALALTGQQVFAENCAVCHGENGAGSEQGPPLIHDIYNPGHHADLAFRRAVTRGVRRHHWAFGDMPAQPQVSASELRAIIGFVRSVQRENGIVYRPHQMR